MSRGKIMINDHWSDLYHFFNVPAVEINLVPWC